MRTSKLFEPFGIPLSGTHLIEASAGTGKTYSIALLFLRLILEAGIPIDKILVVTYTTAAAAELKERIRTFLRLAARAWKDENINNADVTLIVNNYKASSLQEKPVELEEAILRFDECAIFTIHGFCARVLKDNAFEIGVMHEAEMLTDQSALIEEVVADFYRVQISRMPIEIVSDVRADVSLKKLGEFVAPNANIGAQYVRLIDEEAGDPQNFVHEIWPPLKDCWKKESAALKKLLETAPVKRQRHLLKPQNIPELFERLDTMCSLKEALPGYKTLTGMADIELLELLSQSTIDKITKNGEIPPRHEFFALCEAAAKSLKKISFWYKKRLLEFLKKELPKRKEEKNFQGYDDLIFYLYSALQNAAKKEQLVETLRDSFSAALIDEFQDTDRMQYVIFESIFNYEQGRLFLIGDPKQSIYRFRGADIFSYISTADSIGSVFTLGTNYRSDPLLVEAFNNLFDREDKEPFLLPNIRYERVSAAEKQTQPLRINGDEVPPIVIWNVSPEQEISKYDARAAVYSSIAAEIIRLCSTAAIEEAVRPGDIAVLVEKWDQALALKTALASYQIPAIMSGAVSIFASEEAAESLLILRAIAEPSNENFIRGALVTNIIGFTINDINRYNNSDSMREEAIDNFRRLAKLFDDEGFIVMSAALQQMYKVRENLISLPDGERRLTNFLHVTELLHNKSQNESAGRRYLLRWLAEHIELSEIKKEEYELRLESDEDAVRIMTIHGSKGLEFPIVFCPFQWTPAKIKDKNAFSYHEGEHEILLLGGGDETAAKKAEQEILSEKLRLFYVAVTRAKKRCYLAWGCINNTAKSAAEYFLSDMTSRFKNVPQISIEELPEPNSFFTGSEKTDIPLGLRSFGGSIPLDWKVSSFTAMSGAALPLDESSADHDENAAKINDIFVEQNAAALDLPQIPLEGIFAFPRGARPGSALHEIFESVDFAAENHFDVVESVLSAFNLTGSQNEYVPVIEEMVRNVLRAPLPVEPPFCLADISPQKRVSEMGFYFSVNETSPRDFTFLEGNGIVPPFSGYVNGFIDLVFQKNGLFYLLDWKSNYLGSDVSDYNTGALHEEIVRHKYNLQYMIYTLALHRHLSATYEGYDYEKDFGGVFYVFLRGLTSFGNSNGIYYVKPPFEDVLKMEKIFGVSATL